MNLLQVTALVTTIWTTKDMENVKKDIRIQTTQLRVMSISQLIALMLNIYLDSLGDKYLHMLVNRYESLRLSYYQMIDLDQTIISINFFLGSLETTNLVVEELSTKNLNIGILGGALAIALTVVFILIILLFRKKKSNQNDGSYRIEVEPTSN